MIKENILAMSTKSRAKLKWTEEMNWDLLECKKRAKELVGSDTPPCNENGRKKGYIEDMKQLWEEKGYEHLGIRSQNLRDQASGLEKIEHGSSGKSQEDGSLGCDREPPKYLYSLAINVLLQLIQVSFAYGIFQRASKGEMMPQQAELFLVVCGRFRAHFALSITRKTTRPGLTELPHSSRVP